MSVNIVLGVARVKGHLDGREREAIRQLRREVRNTVNGISGRVGYVRTQHRMSHEEAFEIVEAERALLRDVSKKIEPGADLEKYGAKGMLLSEHALLHLRSRIRRLITTTDSVSKKIKDKMGVKAPSVPVHDDA